MGTFLRRAIAISICLLLVGLGWFVVHFGIQHDRQVRDEGARFRLNQELIDTLSVHDIVRVRAALKLGADANAVEHGRGSDLDGTGGWPALLVAAEGPDNGAVEALLDAGANPNVCDERGHTALMVAAALGNVRAVKSLIKKGADLNVRRGNGETALRNASQQGKAAIVSILKSAGAKQ